jgi:hypothetical protein
MFRLDILYWDDGMVILAETWSALRRRWVCSTGDELGAEDEGGDGDHDANGHLWV